VADSQCSRRPPHPPQAGERTDLREEPPIKVSTGLGLYAITDWDEAITLATEAERVGVDSFWSAEAWSHDGVTPLAYLAAKTTRLKLGTGIMQVGTRTPALAAMTAMSMDQITGGRFVLGIGTSGPQVVEGWHGISFDRPVARTREFVEVIRKAMHGEVLEYHGDFYDLPLPGGDGKALKATAPPANVPILIAALGPQNLRLTGELADGWLGTSFIPEHADVFLDPIREGAAAAGRRFEDLDLHAGGTVWFTDDVEEASKQLRGGLAFSLGAMGSRRFNFYNAAYRRQGYADEALEVQRLWQEGRRAEARERVPLDLAGKVNLVGTDDMVRDRLRVYRDIGITQLYVRPHGDTLDERLETLGRVVQLAEEVSAETGSRAR